MVTSFHGNMYSFYIFTSYIIRRVTETYITFVKTILFTMSLSSQPSGSTLLAISHFLFVISKIVYVGLDVSNSVVCDGRIELCLDFLEEIVLRLPAEFCQRTRVANMCHVSYFPFTFLPFSRHNQWCFERASPNSHTQSDTRINHQGRYLQQIEWDYQWYIMTLVITSADGVNKNLAR